MKSAAVYLIAGVLPGLYAFYTVSWIIWGARLNLLAAASLGGSALFLFAAYRAFSSERSAAISALIACVLEACLFAPVVFISSMEPFSTRQEIRGMFSSGEIGPLVGFVGGPFFVIETAAYAIYVLRREVTAQARPN